MSKQQQEERKMVVKHPPGPREDPEEPPPPVDSRSNSWIGDFPPAIYAAPTTETLGDESHSMIRPYAAQTPTRYRRPIQASIVHARIPSPRSTPNKRVIAVPVKTPSSIKQQQQPLSLRRKKSTAHRDFQRDEDYVTVKVRSVNVAQRSAFEANPPISIQEWHRIAEHGSVLRKTNMQRRLSPSLQHLELLHTMQRMTVIRQLDFSPSTSFNSDVFISWDNDEPLPKKNQRDGRYRSIDPVKASAAVLPTTPPVLSNKKMRLPMRSDVGFPNATVEEIQQKQKEISHETAWEESSPRLVVLVTSDDLGVAVQETENEDTELSSSWSRQHLLWNGGGLPGIPFAGRELIQAKERNAQHFDRKNTGLSKFLGPNRCSMLAPPLDASYSESQGWRPRPFHDRPPGLSYCLACTTKVEFDAEMKEPLVGSLTLYSLPKDVRPGQAYGKISEEFWFPAGDWKGKVQLDAVRKEDGSIDQDLLASWFDRKHKAIFSYDPLNIVGGQESLFVVLQVYKVPHPDPLAPYIPERRYESKSSKSTFDTSSFDTESAVRSMNRVYEQFGAQLLTPLCFGVAQFYSSNEMRWPSGETREMQLFAYPATPESQEAFVERLSTIARGVELGQPVPTTGELDVEESSVETEEQKKRGVVGRLFRSPKIVKTRHTPLPDRSSQPTAEATLSGRASIFVSALTVDFLQSMLKNPPELNGSKKREKQLPRLLVDVSGDFAVVVDPKSSNHIFSSGEEEGPKKRSDLLRLPPLSTPAGYLESSEFREVLHLPARPEKHYDMDSLLSKRSLLNLLYLYPRQLRLSNGGGGAELSSFTIRVRIVRNAVKIDEENGQVQSRTINFDAVHSPCPWASYGLQNAAFTKIQGDLSYARQRHGLDLKSGVPIKDEIKLRLPQVLDGTYSLCFSLFSVKLSANSGASLIPVAEVLIPLSSSTTRDTSSGSKVRTVIPNGNHRIKLGDFQLQLETRLVSSVHVADPSVAMALRDFPYAKDHQSFDELGSTLMSGTQKEVSSSFDSFLDTAGTFPSLLSSASASSILGHFDVLVHMHVCNLVNLKYRSNHDSNEGAEFIMGNMRSLFEILHKVKTKLSSASVVENGNKKVDAFFKKYLDGFDEGFLSPASSPWAAKAELDSGAVSDSQSEILQLNQSSSQEEKADENAQEMRDEGAVRITVRTERRPSQYDARVSRIVAALGPSGIPFSRVAYGASKTDRMRIEAELHSDSGHFAPFFDDDETIATAPTFQSNFDFQKSEDLDAFTSDRTRDKGPDNGDDMSQNSIVRSPTHESKPPSAESHASIGNTEFAKRVRTVAQVMLAPCVGPSLSNVLAGGRSSPRRSETDRSMTELVEYDPSAKGLDTMGSWAPGSDAEDEKTPDPNESSNSKESQSAQAIYRGLPDGPLLLFSVGSRDGHEVPVASGEYIYESMMSLWLRAWVDHMEGELSESLDTSSLTGRQISTFPIPKYDPANTTEDNIIYGFYANMDFLLPLCLKSIVLRYTVEVLPMYPPSTRAILDESHMLVLEPFVEMLARGLMGKALSGLGSADDRDSALLGALYSTEVVVDFLSGLFTVFHPEHMNALMVKFFRTLRDCETEHLGSYSEIDFEWTEESLHRVMCSRQIRLRAIEGLAVLPSFAALNYPMKYSGSKRTSRSDKVSWMRQYKEMNQDSSPMHAHTAYQDGIERLPISGWLAELIIKEGLSVCSMSCEAVVAEAMAHMEVSQQESSNSPTSMAPSLKKRPGAALGRDDLLMFQALAVHAISCVYELVLRRHSMDRRFQTESCRSRLAAMFAGPILDKSIASVRWLARMEGTHKVRSTWLLCFVYVLQEAPEVMIREFVRSFCDSTDIRIHRFIRLLRLCSSTFQSFLDLARYNTGSPSEVDKTLSPWLLQESFNTICAATNIVVEECVNLMSSYPEEQRKMMQGILDLELHILTTPQSPVTHLRAVGGALQALEQFGVELFIEITGTSLQHWIRVILSLMNSISLSVRSISVDFVVSLVGSFFEAFGNIDEISIIFMTVLPEVAAREIALYSVGDNISTMEDVATCLWPLRRSFADLEDTNPLDDDRVDPQLAPDLSVFCRACQAVIDGVLIELRLKGDLYIVGTHVTPLSVYSYTFDADEESLFEAANFFVPETAPMQRIRWLLTLKSLHESKEQWIEAAETLMLIARTISDSVPHLKNVWRPSRFPLWSDSRRSHWLDTVGEDEAVPDRGNTQVMDFADEFLEPEDILGTSWNPSTTGKLQQPTVSVMCDILINTAKQAVNFYDREEGMVDIAHHRLESLMKAVMNVLEDHGMLVEQRGGLRGIGITARKRYAEEEAALRNVMARISTDMTSLAERMLVNVQNEPSTPDSSRSLRSQRRLEAKKPCYVQIRFSGKKPDRFQENTTIPTFFEWDTPCVCRVPKVIAQQPFHDPAKSAKKLSLSFAQQFAEVLQKECDDFVLRTEPGFDRNPDPGTTYLHVFPIDPIGTEISQHGVSSLFPKRFMYRNDTGPQSAFVEMTVAHAFPCPLSRQRSLLTTEIVSKTKPPPPPPPAAEETKVML